jgi:acyl-CoA reductase-like NAD-dependent aldehyde dehydrogenase
MSKQATIEITPPDSEAVIASVDLTDPESVSEIVSRAADARISWTETPIAERAACLDRAADSLAARSDELAELLASESGKPIAQATFEIGGSISLLRANAVEGRKIGGRVLPTEGNFGTEYDLAVTRRVPLGVVAAILPFNFPVELFVEKCAAALVVGNAVVCKPPLEAPLAVAEFHGALIAAGVPEQVMALVQGDADVGEALVTAPDTAAVSLTGSTGAGLAVAKATVDRLRPLHLELGGNNACVVLGDADLDLVAEEVTRGRLMMNGQACSASKRIIVDAKLHDPLADRLVAVASEKRVGPATAEDTEIGPLIHDQAAGGVAAQVARAVEQGATLAAGSDSADGAYFSPAVLSGVPGSAAVAGDDEIFGPVFTLIPFSGGPAEALQIANSSSFGLMSSVFTADLRLAWSMAERLESGGVVINGSDNYRPPIIPFGGVKLSGTGREGIGYTIEDLSREKTIVLRRFRGETIGG